VLDGADRPSSLAASLSTLAELLKDHVDVVATKRGCWGTRSMLVTTLWHFLMLEAELEVLWSERNADLMKDQMDALWHHMSFLRLPVVLLMARGSSSGGRLRPCSFALM
jgi:hypothetical protein